VRWLVAGQPSVLDLLQTGTDVVLLALLLHEDSRDWVRGAPDRPGRAWERLLDRRTDDTDGTAAEQVLRGPGCSMIIGVACTRDRGAS
jgi:hypothetical protein